MNRTKL